MKIGDTVRFKDVEKRAGILLDLNCDRWWNILSDGKIVVYPECQLEVINESR